MRFLLISLPAGTTEIMGQIPASDKLSGTCDTLKKNNNASEFAWQAKKTGAVEQALQKASGLSKRFVSFLAQNIGWFISCFFFITGSLFLVSYTADFVRAAIISIILFTYTLLMLMGAYQIRRKRPDLYITSRVLNALGMFLIPLCIAASVRLADFSFPAGIAMSLINMGVFYWLAQLASGITDRSLQGTYPRIFMGLAAIQTAVPLIDLFPGLPLVAFFHFTIMGITGYGLIKFTREWLKLIFVEKNKTAYYAAGTIVYAASISFAHITLSYKPALPEGYFGPFVMILAGLLFYVDSQIKKQNLEFAFLSKLTFGIYGLSIFAIAVSFGSPVTKIITLALGSFVYGTMVWHYLTLVPMWLFLGCLSLLYNLIILAQVPKQFFFLASLPGLACLLWMQRYALKRNAINLGSMIFKARSFMAFGLAFFSFWNSVPGMIGFLTGITITGFTYATFCSSFLQRYGGLHLNTKLAVLIEFGKDLRNTRLFYAVPFFTILSMIYAPVMVKTWAFQFSSGLLIPAFIWTGSGINLYKKKKNYSDTRISVLINSGILCIAASLLIALIMVSQPLQSMFLIPALLAGSFLMLWLTIIFRTSFTFYAFLILCAWAWALIKQTWFPGLSVGMFKMTIALGLFALTWKMERINKLNAQFKDEFKILAESGQPVKILGIFPVRFQPLSQIMLKPLNRAMIILWAAALYKLGKYIVVAGLTPAWILNTAMGTFLTILLILRHNLFNMIFLPVIMGLITLISAIYHTSYLNIHLYTFSAALYALGVWLFSRKALSLPFFSSMIDLVKSSLKPGDNNKIVLKIHQTTYGIIVACSSLSLLFWTLKPESLILVCISVSMIFVHLSLRNYHTPKYCYDFLILAVTAALIVHVRVFSISLPVYLIPDSRTGLLFSLLSFGMAGFKWYSKGIYKKPLGKTSVILSLFAGLQSIILSSYTAGFNLIIIASLGISGAALLLTSHDIKTHKLRLSGILLISFSFFCTGTWLTHPDQLFYLWPIGRGGWITLTVLTLVLSVLHGVSRIPDLYKIPIQRIGISVYVFLLIKGLSLLVSVPVIVPPQVKTEIYVPCFLLILSLSGYFFLTQQPSQTYLISISAVGTFIAGVILFFYPLFSLALLFSLSSAFLLIVLSIINPENLKTKSIKLYKAVSDWLCVMPWLSMAALLILPVKSLAETVVITGVLAVVTAGLGWKKNQPFMFKVSKLLGLVLIHIWPMFFIPSKKGAAFTLWQIWPVLAAKFNQIQVLFPWYALELCLIVWGIIGLRHLIINGLGNRLPFLNRIRLKIKFLGMLAFIEWITHIFIIITNPWQLNTQYAQIQGIAFLAAGILLILTGIRQIAITQKPVWVYFVFLLAGISGLYLRVLWVGFAPANIWDTAALLILSGITFTCHHLTRYALLSLPLLRMTMILPLLSLLTLPWHLASGHTGAALLGAGLIYLSLYYTTYDRTGRSLFLYMAAIMMNTAIYLWIPVWAENSNLLHLYTVPAAMSVLVLLHLHKKELKKSVLNKARLTTVCILYASAGLDVFLRPELFVFIMALGLSLGGVISGIALQIRAFLYGGIVFMVINIMGQLLRFYPDGRLEKGIILVTLGAVIMSAMIWFNIKREDILDRIRIFRADLAQWE